MEPSLSSQAAHPKPIQTVLGEIPYDSLGITDAHNHVWIDPVSGADPSAPVLNQYDSIRSELVDYREAGGYSLLDCQPGGCGRNANQLVRLSKETGVNIVACTGFHRRKYYPPEYWLFSASEAGTSQYFTGELLGSLEETETAPKPVRAGFIKLALEADWKDTPLAALAGAAEAARQTHAMIEIHTEKGALAEKGVLFFEGLGVKPTQLVLCHMDKRPDPVLHTELASYGVMLEYDTFYRPKYEPETNLWPLIQKMAQAGLGFQVALATDMAESEMYRSIGRGPGLASLATEIMARLVGMELPMNTIQGMLGGNIARRLAGLP